MDQLVTADRFKPSDNNSSYDTALPQGWVDYVRKVSGINPVGHFVWSYDHGSIFGFPMPLDTAAAHILARVYGTGRDHANEG